MFSNGRALHWEMCQGRGRFLNGFIGHQHESKHLKGVRVPRLDAAVLSAGVVGDLKAATEARQLVEGSCLSLSLIAENPRPR